MQSLRPHIINPPIPNSQQKIKHASEFHNAKCTDLVLEFSLEWHQIDVENLTIVAAEDMAIAIVHGNFIIKFSLEIVRSDVSVTDESAISITGV